MVVVEEEELHDPMSFIEMMLLDLLEKVVQRLNKSRVIIMFTSK